MQGLYGYIPLNGGRTRTLPGSEYHRTRTNNYPITFFTMDYGTQNHVKFGSQTTGSSMILVL
jgi:hypothetical protein